jgi:hypothetical protein
VIAEDLGVCPAIGTAHLVDLVHERRAAPFGERDTATRAAAGRTAPAWQPPRRVSPNSALSGSPTTASRYAPTRPRPSSPVNCAASSAHCAPSSGPRPLGTSGCARTSTTTARYADTSCGRPQMHRGYAAGAVCISTR